MTPDELTVSPTKFKNRPFTRAPPGVGHARAVAIISARHLAASVRKVHVAFARRGLAVRSESGGQGYGSFVKSVLEAVDKFYADVVQRIKP